MKGKSLPKNVKKALKISSSEEEKKEILSLDPEGVIDVLDDEGKLVYLLDSGETTDKVEIENTVYSPPTKSGVPYLFAEKEKVLKLIKDNSDTYDADLYTLLLSYHKEISDLPNELYYHLLVLWDFHTYLLEKLYFSPMLYLYATKERGKSRTGKGCLYVSRRGIFTETVREPDIIRWGNDHKASIGFDVKDFPKKIQRANCDDLILARFQKGSTSSRTLWPDRGAFRDTKTFKLFGPTIVMTNRPVDDILESRTISIDMKPSKKRFNNEVLETNALDLKAKLTAFEFKHKDEELQELDKPLMGRIGDILSPLNNIVNSFFPERIETFNKIIELTNDKKQEDAVDTFEAKILEAVINGKDKVISGYLSIEYIALIFNAGKSEKFSVTNDTIGRTLKGLGFSPRREAGGKRGIFYDIDLINDIAGQYGLVGVCVSASQVSLTENLVATSSTEEEEATEEKQASLLLEEVENGQ